MLRWSLVLCVVAAVVCVAAAVALWPSWESVRVETEALADAHQAHEVAHPGWTFPARVYSAEAPLDLPPKRLALHAKSRGYAEKCPPEQPGEYCAKTGEVIPRGGLFPEGVQPPGTEGWTRPLALEPVRIGTLIGPDAEIRWHLPLDEAPELLTAAIMAAEDEAFRSHMGVNPRAILRAAWSNYQGTGVQQGASTLTMQMARMLTGRKEKTIARKAAEAATAVALDRHVGKDGVLQMYLDSPYLGQWGSFSICGFRAAAWYYWGIEPKDLTLGQAATLAGILPAPGRFSPDRYPDRARERRDLVLGRMEALGWDVASARAEPVEATPHGLPEDRYPAYLQATRLWLEGNLPPEVVYGAGLDVFTALDLAAQDAGDKLLPERVRYLEQAVGRHGKDPLQSAAALLDSASGALVAVYGGDLSLQTDFNRATQARRQPGSAFKPLVYALAFNQPGEDGKPAFTAAHAVPNAPRTFENTGGWRPRNVGGEYSSTTCLANGLAWSQNIATASLLEECGGPGPLIELAGRLGFDTSSFPEEMGLALGQGEVTPLEMARFVATIIDGGQLADGSPVLRATDAAGRIRVAHQGPGDPVLSAEAAALTRDLMRLVIEFGTGGASRGGGGFPGYQGPAIGKTGTTDSEKDLWFVGGTPRYSGALWLGYDQPVRIGASASDLAAPLWGWWMRAVHEGLPADDFGGLKLEHRAICTISGKLSNGSCPLVPAPFLPDTGPKERCPNAHEPAPVKVEVEGEDGPKKYEGLWKRKAREAEEAADAPPAE